MNRGAAMSEAPNIALAVVAGAVLGAMFYGGLWWTVRKGLLSRQPAVWFLTSLVVRTAVALLGFYAVFRGDWRRLVACMAGFVLARLLVTRLTRTLPEPLCRPLKGGAP
jgi:F1F0 ATPase subunit 2